jgi:uncharacterized protein (DUF58 family)
MYRLGLLFGLALPITTLLLAQLFDSALLGWLFGLMLMLGTALLPVAALVYVALMLRARRHRRAAETDAPPAGGMTPLTVQIERDGVHASDDAWPKQIVVDPGTTLRAMLGLAMADGFLPGISGGRATWVVEPSRDGIALAPLAVCAQQWAQPAFLQAPDTTVAAHFGRAAPGLRFRYRCQADPDAIFAEIARRRQ